jgi:hypothetical protein
VGRPVALDLGVRRGDPPSVARPQFLLARWERGGRHVGGVGTHLAAAVAADWVQDGGAAD